MRHVANLVTMPPQSATLCMAAPPPTGPSPDQRRRSRLPCGPAGKPSLPRPPSGPRGPYCSAAVSNLRRGREPEFRLGRCWTSGQGRGRCAGAAGPTTATPGSSDLKMRERRETCAVVRSSPRRGIGARCLRRLVVGHNRFASLARGAGGVLGQASRVPPGFACDDRFHPFLGDRIRDLFGSTGSSGGGGVAWKTSQPGRRLDAEIAEPIVAVG